MEAVDSIVPGGEQPDPDQLIGMFVAVAQAREHARNLSYERAYQRTIYGAPETRIYEAWQTAEVVAHAARLALSKTIENEWLNRRVRVELLNKQQGKHHGIAPMSHTEDHSTLKIVEGAMVIVPGYEDCNNVLFIQAHPELPYYMTHVLNNQHEPLIAITVLDEEQI